MPEAELDVSLASLDSLIEQKALSKIREVKTDYEDALKVILYLEALVPMCSDDSQKQAELLELCYDMCVSHGFLANALNYALRMETTGAINHVRELFNFCTDLSLHPRSHCEVVKSDTQWRPTAYVVWEFTDEAKERLLRDQIRLQLSYVLAEQRFVPDLQALKERHLTGSDAIQLLPMSAEVEIRVDSILRRDHMTNMFDYLVAELDVVAPKKVEDILRSDDANSRNHAGNLEPCRNAMAASYASGFIHCGYGVDFADEDQIQKTRIHGVTAAISSIGLLNLWRVEQGLSELDKYQYSRDNFTSAGALIGFGCCNSGTCNDCDPVLSLVGDFLSVSDLNKRMAAYIALGYAYCGSEREDLKALLLPVIKLEDSSANLESASTACLALGLIYAGSADKELVLEMLGTLASKTIDTVHVFNYGVAVGLIYLMTGKGADDEQIEEALSKIDHPMQQFTRILMEGCSFACSGDVLRCQKYLKQIVEFKAEQAKVAQELAAAADDIDKRVAELTEKDTAQPLKAVSEAPPTEAAATAAPTIAEASKEAGSAEMDDGSAANNEGEGEAPTSDKNNEETVVQSVSRVVKSEITNSIPGLALIAYTMIVLGESLGEEMILRMYNHMLQYDDLGVRRAVPLALALLSPSAPKPMIVDVLSKLSHDADADTALHAITAFGVVAAGTNNARVAQLLRSLASFYSVDCDGLFLVKLSQGLVHTGKGLHTLSPLRSDKKLVIKHSLAGLIAFVVQGLFTPETLCQARYHLNVLHLCLAIRPRWLITVDESGATVPVPVRVGTYVDVAGIAGQPRQVAGFRNHNTPILLSDGEKAEIGCAEWQPLTSSMEGIVVVRKTDPAELKEASRSLE